MIYNYLKIAIRNLGRNKTYSFINIMGLTIGLTACLLVATVVLDDLSYDRQWKNSPDIYRIVTVDRSSKNANERTAGSFTGLGPALQSTFPEVSAYCRMHVQTSRLKMGADKDGVVIGSLDAEPSIWKVLNFDVVQGTPRHFVAGYKNLVISEKLKTEYFPHTNPIGKTITDIPEFGKPSSYLITGVIKNIPTNTYFRADAIEIREMPADDNILQKQGYGTWAEQYLLLKPGASAEAFTLKANKWLANYLNGKSFRYAISLQPIKDIYLHSTDLSEYGHVQGDICNVYIFSGVAILLLLIACINFVNLTAARALKRVREAGIRKILGAERRELIAQFLLESMIFFIVSFILGMLCYRILLMPVETYLGHRLALTFQNNFVLLAATFGILLLISMLTGLYPALLVSRQNPVYTLKGKLNARIGSNFLRKGLIVAQFTISVAVLAFTIVVQRQLHFMDNKNPGFDKNNLLHLDEISWDGKGPVFKQQALMIPGVQSATITTWYPSGGGGYMSMPVDDPHQKNSKIKTWYINADLDFVRTMKFHLEKGRLFNPALSADALNADSMMRINMTKFEAAQAIQPTLVTAFTAEALDIKEFNKTTKGVLGTPVGIINNFYNESLKTPMKPVLIHASRSIDYGSMLLRIKPGTEKQVVADLYQIWQQFFPGKVFQYDWIDDLLRNQYQAEHKLQQLFTLFSMLILFLAGLGLFGLTSFFAELRVKEVGIRKVLGASVASISIALSREFIKLVLIAILIASPIAFYFAGKWLGGYAYKITVHWWLFALSGMAAILIALATMSVRVIKAAMANPVKSLRSE